MISVWSALILGSSLLVNIATATSNGPSTLPTVGREVSESVLEVEKEGGLLRFPFYDEGPVQYFSAGVGIEERQVRYPAFPLKLIFVEGKREYLTGVRVDILNSEGATVVTIPKEHVTGPWLFVKTPPGTYMVMATNKENPALERRVQIHEGQSSTLYFRWSAK